MKLIYNVTVNISDEKHEDWLHWMQTKHISDVMETGFFEEYRMCKVLSDDPEGQTYSIQYVCTDRAKLNNYLQQHAPKLQEEHKSNFEGHYVAFRTLLEWIH
ncbi:MAG: DUF4286 family protein [Flavobacteriales bacterium]